MKQRTIITNKSNHRLIQNELLKDEKQIFGVQILDPYVWISTIIGNNPHIFEQYLLLKELELDQFKDFIKNCGFLREIVKIKDDCAKYGIEIADLPYNDELKLILNTVKVRDYKKLDRYIDENDFSEYEFTTDTNNVFLNNIFKKLEAGGAKEYKFNINDNTSYQIKCQTKADQFEKAIYYIKKNKLNFEDCCFVLSEEANANVLIAMLERHDIPYNNTILGKNNRKALQMYSILNYLDEPTAEKYQLIADLHTYGMTNENFYRYVRYHIENEELNKPFTRLKDNEFTGEGDNNHTKEKYLKREEDAQRVNAKILNKLSEVDQNATLLEKVNIIFNQIDTNDAESYLLRSRIQRNVQYLNYEEYLPFLLEELSNMQTMTTNNKGITITKIDKAIHNFPYVFVFDCDSLNFPNSVASEGLMNEDLILKINNYPPFTERYQLNQEYLKYLDEAQETYYFYSEGDYEGRSLEKAFILQNEIKYKSLEIDNPYYKLKEKEKTTTLNKEYRRFAFDKDNNLKGSLSSFEDYFQCPYFYFLKKGLGLKEENEFDINPLTIGNFIHEILNELNTIYAYPLCKQNNFKGYYAYIDQLLKSKFKELELLRPHLKYIISTYRNHCQISIYNYIKLLEYKENNKEEDEFYVDKWYSEVKLERLYKNKLRVGDYEINFSGTADLIAFSNEQFYVEDYKTSQHSIKYQELVAGLQLQLLTYAYYIYQNTKSYPKHCIYTNLGSLKRDNYVPYSFAGSKGFEKNKDTPNDTDNISVDTSKLFKFADEDAHFEYSNTDRSIFNHSFKQIRDILDAVYSKLINEINEGHFPLSPVEKAVMYNPLFSGVTNARNKIIVPELIYFEKILKEKKGAKKNEH